MLFIAMQADIKLVNVYLTLLKFGIHLQHYHDDIAPLKIALPWPTSP